MELDQEIYNRLIKYNLIKQHASHQINPGNDKITVDKDIVSNIENGIIIARYLAVISRLMSEQGNPSNIDVNGLAQMKASSTAAAKLFNWNCLAKEVEKVGVPIDQDTKSLIVAGDIDLITDLLYQVDGVERKLSGGNSRRGSQASMRSSRRGAKPQQKKAKKEGVDILTMNPDRDINDTENTLEFLLNTLCKSFTMKPKQAAALLTNQNQYLVHSVVKGIKGKFEPVIQWYQDVYANSRVLSDLIKEEHASQTPMALALNTLKAGFYSHNSEVSSWCCRLFQKIAHDFQSHDLYEEIWKFYCEEKDGGFFCLFNTFKRHPDITDQVVATVIKLSQTQLETVLRNFIKKHLNTTCEYLQVVNDWVHYLCEYENVKAELIANGLAEFWLEQSIRQSDNDGKHTNEERVTGISLMTELWQLFPEVVESKEELSQNIQHMLKRGSRDKYKPIKMSSLTYSFKLLDSFTQQKHAAAPQVLKALAFSLVENHSDLIAREFLMTNFIQFFDNNPSVPVTLIMEPLLKQIAVSENITYFWNVFDFEFFQNIAKHPKLSVQNGLQLIDLMAKIYLNDNTFAGASAVPFMLVASKYHEMEAIRDFLQKLTTICISLLLQNEKSSKVDKQALKASTLKKSREQIAEEQKAADDEFNRKYKKSLIVELLRRIQSLKNEDINEQMKQQLLSSNKRNKDLFHGQNKGMLFLLNFWGGGKQLADQYIKKIEDTERKKKEEEDKLKREEEERKKKEHEERVRLHQEQQKRDKEMRRSMDLVPYSDNEEMQAKRVRDSLALVSFINKRPQNKIGKKACLELDKIKLDRETRAEKNRLEEEDAHFKNQKQRKNISKQIERRMIEHGVGTKNMKDDAKSIVFKDREGKQIKIYFDPNEIQLTDLENEEDRDKNALAILMGKYHKLFHHFFTKYSNIGYSTKDKSNFDALGNKSSTMNMAEFTKLLKDHDISTKMIKREEMQALFRLVNLKLRNSHDLQALDFEGFKQVLVQSAIIIYSRPPKDLSHLPPVESVRTLLKHFEDATKKRGQSLILYEDPDITSISDKDLILELTKRVKENPEYPIPEGFKKIEEKDIEYKYELPENLPFTEGQKMGIEVMDDFLNELFGIHIIEPIATYKTITKVRPTIKKDFKPQQSQNYLQALQKTVKNRQIGSAKNDPLVTKSLYTLNTEIAPKLSTQLKVLVAEFPIDERPEAKETAETLEEMLQAVSKGLKVLPPRAKYGTGNIPNRVKEFNQQSAEEAKAYQQEREQKRQERDGKLKGKLEKQKEVKKEEMKEQRAERKELRQKAKEEADASKAKYEAKMERKKAKIEEKRAEEIEAIENEANDPDKEKKLEENKEWLKQQKKKNRLGFKEQKHQRENIAEAEREIYERNQAAVQKTKEKVAKYLEDTKDQRGFEKKVREEVTEFNSKDDVTNVYKKFDKVLYRMFKFYAAQDKKEIGPGLDEMFESINYKEWVKFGYQTDIIPNIITPEEHTYIFRFLIRERQEETKKDQTALDYDYFKKALTHVAAQGYEYFGGLDEEKYMAKKEEKENKAKHKQEITQKMTMKYNEQQQARMQQEMERAKKAQQLEEERLRLKKEGVKNLMVTTKKKADDDEEGEEDNDQTLVTGKKKKETAAARALDEMESKKIKNREKNIIRDLDRQEDVYMNIEKIKVDDKLVHEPSDVSLISHQTIESLLRFIDLDPTEKKYDQERKLASKRTEMMGGAKPNKMKKAHLPTKAEAAKKDEELERDDDEGEGEDGDQTEMTKSRAETRQ